MARRPMRVSIEIAVEINDPSSLIATARDYYERSASLVDVSRMTTKEALAVGDLKPEGLRAHPRRLTARQAIPDGESAAAAIVTWALENAGAMVESSCTQLFTGARHDRKVHPRRGQPHPGSLPRARRS